MKVFKIFFFIIIFAGNIYSEELDYYSKGVNFYLDGRMEDALKSLEKAHNKNPDNMKIIGLYSEVLVLVGGRHFEKGDYEEALKYISKARKLKPKDEKINRVYTMLDEKLNPEKYKLKAPEDYKDVFSDLKDGHEEKRVERIKIIREPPQKLTVKEIELLRPIIIDGGGGRNNIMYYILIGGGVLFIGFLFFAGYWVKQIILTSRKNMELVSAGADEKVRKMSDEIKKIKQRELIRLSEESEKEKEAEKNLSIREEKLKNEYSTLLKKSLAAEKSGMSNLKVLPEPEIPVASSSETEKEIKNSFRDLKKTNYTSAVELLKKMVRDNNPWIRLWSAELCAELNIEEGVEILKFLSADEEYQVKKSVLKVLRRFSESGDVTTRQKEAIKHLIYESRRDGWVV